MSGEPYSDKENSILLKDLADSDCCLRKENLISLEDLWLGLSGRKRSAFALFLQSLKLAKQNGILAKVVSSPRKRKDIYRKIPPKRKEFEKLHDQILVIIQREFSIASKIASADIFKLVSTLSKENKELKKEICQLKPFQGVVEQAYRKEMKFRGKKII